MVEPGQPVPQLGEGHARDGVAVAVVDHHLGRGAAERREVVAKHLDAHLGAGVGDVVVVLGGAAERAGERERGRRDEHPGGDGPPRVGRGGAPQAVQEA
jgi:hypothetical protein